MKANKDPALEWVRDRSRAAACAAAIVFAIIVVAATIAGCDWMKVAFVAVTLSIVWFYFRLPRWPGFWCVHCSIRWMQWVISISKVDHWAFLLMGLLWHLVCCKMLISCLVRRMVGYLSASDNMDNMRRTTNKRKVAVNE